jgi:inner membrane protein
MLAITHAAIALSGTSLILGTANPLTLGLAIIGSQLPDLGLTEKVVTELLFL